MNVQSVSIDRITIPERVERPGARVEDDVLRKSIRDGGIQQPLVAVVDGGSMLLADGIRRLRVARELGIGKVPVVLDEVPLGEQPEEYVRRLRFVLDHHRQDLLPTQKAELIETLKRMFGMKHRQIAAYLGVDEDSITNWITVKSYIEPVRLALDAGALSMKGARVFSGMTDKGQQFVWKKHQRLLLTDAGERTHRDLRAEYPPTKHPDFYQQPEVVRERMARAKKQRKARPRPAFTADDKRRLLGSYEIREQEVAELRAEQKQLKSEISATIPIVAAIRRSEKLWGAVPAEVKPELERFCELYV